MKSNYLLLAILLSVVACGGSKEGDEDPNLTNTDPSNLTNEVLTTPSAGRLLASQCAQCHGTDGISVSGIESLAGESDEILEEMFEMKRSTRNRVMHLQAKGYSDEQIRQIADYFSSLYQGGKYNNNDNDNDNEEDDDDELDDDLKDGKDDDDKENNIKDGDDD